ncbi:hypothetical protein C0J52_16556 [Blattella germanica]|nr:hypothetical protein C0J52_16556 [Blattella germanica]
MQTSGFALGTMISNALGIDPQSTLSGGARTTFLANVVRNSNIITTSTTTTTTSTTTTTTSTTTPAPSSSTTTATTSSPSTAVSTAQPNTTPNSVAGALEDFTLLNALVNIQKS